MIARITTLRVMIANEIRPASGRDAGKPSGAVARSEGWETRLRLLPLQFPPVILQRERLG